MNVAEEVETHGFYSTHFPEVLVFPVRKKKAIFTQCFHFVTCFWNEPIKYVCYFRIICCNQ